MGIFNIFKKNKESIPEADTSERKEEREQTKENTDTANVNKIFEDEFTDIQADMISICLENVDGRADMIYVYGSYESGTMVSTYFYKIHGMIVSRGKLNDALRPDESPYDVSVERQKQVTKILMDDMKQLKAVCETYQRPMPTEMKLTYDVSKNSLDAEYQYENVYSNQVDKDAYDIAAEWMASEQ